MWCKFSSLLIVLIALGLAILGSSSSLLVTYQGFLTVVAKFFDIMLPVLGVGALLKYLLSCSAGCICRCCIKKRACGEDKSCVEGAKVACGEPQKHCNDNEKASGVEAGVCCPVEHGHKQ